MNLRSVAACWLYSENLLACLLYYCLEIFKLVGKFEKGIENARVLYCAYTCAMRKMYDFTVTQQPTCDKLQLSCGFCDGRTLLYTVATNLKFVTTFSFS